MPPRDAPILVIGAGAAGLAAARVLTAAGRPVRILEARDRIGGRIHTLRHASLPLPIELGPEFVHGESEEISGIVRAHGLTTCETGEAHAVLERGRLGPVGAFWSRVERVLQELDAGGADRSVEAALHPRRRSKSGEWAARYVEGFHAADLARMSVRALARSERGQGSGSSGSVRILNGYDALVSAMAVPLHGPLVDLRLRTVAREIRWTRGRVTVTTDGAAGEGREEHDGPAAIVTVPLGVLKDARGPAGIRIVPMPSEWLDAMRLLEMGSVLRLVLQFREVPWPPDLGFLHLPGALLPTWWTPAPIRAPMITAWAGGPSAERLLGRDRQELAAVALDVLAPAIGVERERLGDLLVDAYHHDWSADPFSRGAYSHALVGGADAFGALGRPVEGTLVAAGEATAADGENGTVQGAIASGERAARAILAGL